MNRAEKIEAAALLEGELQRASVAVLADYRGLTVGELNRLRRAVRDADGRCRVAKNTLAKRSIANTRYKAMEPLLRGPLAMIIGFGDPVAIAKVAVKFADELPKLELKGGVIDGALLPVADVKALATLPPREVVLAQLLGLLQAPASRLLRTLNEPAAQLARLVDALGKRAGGGEAASS